MLKAIEQLKAAAAFPSGGYSSPSEALRRITDTTTEYYALEAIANDAERELAREYMKLPVGKDGRPIHPGDWRYTESGEHVCVIAIGAPSKTHNVWAQAGGELKPLKACWLSADKPDPYAVLLREAVLSCCVVNRSINGVPVLEVDDDELEIFAEKFREVRA